MGRLPLDGGHNGVKGGAALLIKYSVAASEAGARFRDLDRSAATGRRAKRRIVIGGDLPGIPVTSRPLQDPRLEIEEIPSREIPPLPLDILFGGGRRAVMRARRDQTAI